MEIFSEQRQIGDYIILECLRENAMTRTWSAQQVSVGRAVLIDELKVASPENREVFLTDVRAKAAVEHPLVGSIYEASNDKHFCFFAYELLPGETVTQLAQAGQKFKAQRFVQLLRRTAEANIYHETHQNSTSPLGPDDIHIDSQGIIRIENLAIHGERDPNESIRDIVQLGSFSQNLLDPAHPGTTRCLTLLAWMRGEDTEHYLTWSQIRDYCEQIEQQLSEPTENNALRTASIPAQKKNPLIWAGVAAAGFIVCALIFIPLIMKKKNDGRSSITKQEWIDIRAGDYSIPGGDTFSVSEFSISNREVSIGEYAKFLNTLDLLAKESNQGIFDHPEQPPEKGNHRPDDWSNLYESAKRSKVWNDRKINLNSPVVGVDWWDAFAFAKWKKCALPTQEQWHAALVSETKNFATIPVSEWPPSPETPDRTDNNIVAMAGSVSEWTAEPRISPSNPFGNPQWVIIGGSYLRPGKGSLSQEWIEKRSTRRSDLGFRICKPKS
jgi:hypothetical protein